jgi:hypothetical protein
VVVVVMVMVLERGRELHIDKYSLEVQTSVESNELMIGIWDVNDIVDVCVDCAAAAPVKRRKRMKRKLEHQGLSFRLDLRLKWRNVMGIPILILYSN